MVSLKAKMKSETLKNSGFQTQLNFNVTNVDDAPAMKWNKNFHMKATTDVERKNFRSGLLLQLCFMEISLPKRNKAIKICSRISFSVTRIWLSLMPFHWNHCFALPTRESLWHWKRYIYCFLWITVPNSLGSWSISQMLFDSQNANCCWFCLLAKSLSLLTHFRCIEFNFVKYLLQKSKQISVWNSNGFIKWNLYSWNAPKLLAADFPWKAFLITFSFDKSREAWSTRKWRCKSLRRLRSRDNTIKLIFLRSQFYRTRQSFFRREIDQKKRRDSFQEFFHEIKQSRVLEKTA